ncbi:uncharacterized protein LOC126315329 [Schistocerca gregaria]|uniref:uncharacterized protein LOC126315329 n=1 Tax=Schistocerca gregaria TaxID=7010 RepID=UPI00211E01C8|nr:uncharacterized protein LOC126315329 [Schistocerca gregaria]
MPAVESQLEALWNILKQKAPILRPKIIPRGYDDEQLSSLCNSTQFQLCNLEKQALELTHGRCSICDQEMRLAARLATEWSFNFKELVMSLNKLMVLCSTCYELTDLEAFLTKTMTSHNSELESQLSTFCKLNGYNTENPVKRALYVEECYSIAYSIKTILSNCPKLKIANQEFLQLEKKNTSDILSILQLPQSAKDQASIS